MIGFVDWLKQAWAAIIMLIVGAFHRGRPRDDDDKKES
jgi:hypothetical protein